MKLKIEIETPSKSASFAITRLMEALRAPETRELLDAYKKGDDIKLSDDKRKTEILITIVEK